MSVGGGQFCGVILFSHFYVAPRGQTQVRFVWQVPALSLIHLSSPSNFIVIVYACAWCLYVGTCATVSVCMCMMFVHGHMCHGECEEDGGQLCAFGFILWDSG